MQLKGLRRKTALIMAFLFVLAALTACGQKGRLRIGTAGEGGNYNSLGKALSQTLHKDPYKINVEVKTTAGSAANIRLLSQDYLELAIAGIASVSDLAGKKVSVGEADSGTQKNAAQILQAYGLTSNMLTVQNMTYAEASKALGDGSIDAMFCTAGAPAQVITDLSGTTPVSLVPIEGQQSDLLTGAYGFYAKAVIPAGTYKGQDSDVTTLAVMSVLLASDKTPADKIYTITGALFKEKTALNDAVPVEFDLQEQKAVESVTIPFHPGAAQYYQECGITVQTSGE